MIATFLAVILFCTTVIALIGWWSATQRIVFLDAMLDAMRDEAWPEGEI